MAPSMPFFAEYLFQKTRENNEAESVHLVSWPKLDKKKIDKDLQEKMEEVRAVVNLALAERIVKGIKVKQPLASLKIKNLKSKIKNDNAFLDLIKDEVNIKEIIFDEKIEGLEELKDEGLLREIIRAVRELRKEQNLVPQDKISVEILVPKKEKLIIEKNKDLLLKEFRATEIFVEENINTEKYSIKIQPIK
jgi:valyl-tRNA synthetase